uniref:Elongation of very long chain fatty acids protein n=1 Tax=Blattella germanica TaxID=6973 RepID=A0A8F7GNR6_BLAGE|nr:fatty acid elongase 17 [Blattella germanica]
MVSWINATRSTYNYYVDELADHRSDHMLFMSSPWPSILISIVYIYLVWGLGPHLMKDRKPFKLDGVISTYNFVQMVLSAYLVERSFSLGWGRKYRMFCEPVDYSNDPEAINAVYGSWLYYIIKIMELLDTIFFVLRKKNNQATFLHVYHHAAQVVSSWIWVRYVPGGHGTFGGSLNCFVHIWMYGYYFITTTWPEYRQRMWWKKYLTQLQMVQFLLVFLHTLPTFFMDCPYPFVLRCFILYQSTVFFLLFFNFYRKAYRKKKEA